MSRLMWCVKQLFPLTYWTRYILEGERKYWTRYILEGERKFCIWKMWFGHSYNISEFLIKAEDTGPIYHLPNGYAFKRLEDGRVGITKSFNFAGTVSGTEKLVMSASEWASIVAAMSAKGENGGTHKAALAFHMEEL